MQLLPKLVGYGDVLLRRAEAQRYGGRGRFAFGACLELLASFVIGAATSFATGLFLLGLPFGLGTGWASQKRETQGLSWYEALQRFWPQTMFGLIVSLLFAQQGIFAVIASSPFTLVYLLTIPFAVLTANPKFGIWLAKQKICAIPEEFAAIAVVEDGAKR